MKPDVVVMKTVFALRASIMLLNCEEQTISVLLHRASLRQRSRSQLSNVVPDPPLCIAGDQAESVYLMSSYGEDDGQTKKVRSNSSLLNCNQKGHLLIAC